MSSRIIVPTSSNGRTPDTTPPASSYDLGQKIRAAVAAGIFVWVGLTVLMWAALAVIREFGGRPPWEAWAATLGIAFFVGLVVTCGLGLEWVIKVAIRPWLVDDDERAYQRKLTEDAKKEQEAAAARAAENIRSGPMDHDHNPATLTQEQRYHLVAHEMLSRACLGRGKPTRDAMEADGVCSQAEWNLVNDAMCKIGLRHGYTWKTVLFEDAWDTWMACFKLGVDEYGTVYAWAMKPGGTWKVVERVG
jgi:hypothetical protein